MICLLWFLFCLGGFLVLLNGGSVGGKEKRKEGARREMGRKESKEDTENGWRRGKRREIKIVYFRNASSSLKQVTHTGKNLWGWGEVTVASTAKMICLPAKEWMFKVTSLSILFHSASSVPALTWLLSQAMVGKSPLHSKQEGLLCSEPWPWSYFPCGVGRTAWEHTRVH